MDDLDKEVNDKLVYYTILYDRARAALSVYESSIGIDPTVVSYQRHIVEQSKRQLESFKKDIGL